MSLKEQPARSECNKIDPSLHTVYERRYRTSKYFLEDQLRCSEAVRDFRTVKSTLGSTSQFNVRQAFRFASEPVPVYVAVEVGQTQRH